MKHYTEQKTHWRESTALRFFLNFIRNHNGSVNDSGTFDLVSGLLSHEQWIDLIQKSFPERTIERMKKTPGRNRLNFADEPDEIIREIWCTEYARKRLRKILSEVVKEELLKNPPENFTNETFAEKVSEQGRKTNRENGIGFNKNDAPILSELAETFLAKGYLTRSELQTVSRKIQKYRKQWE